jgi:hypothetical protein
MLPGITFDSGALQKPIGLVVCGSEGGGILGEALKDICTGMQSYLALRFHTEHTQICLYISWRI